MTMNRRMFLRAGIGAVAALAIPKQLVADPVEESGNDDSTDLSNWIANLPAGSTVYLEPGRYSVTNVDLKNTTFIATHRPDSTIRIHRCRFWSDWNGLETTIHV